MTQQPRHHLPSWGRVDIPADAPAPMTVTRAQPNQAPPQADTITVQSMKLLVDALPAALRQEVAAINARDLDTQDRVREISALADRAKPVIRSAVEAVAARCT